MSEPNYCKSCGVTIPDKQEFCSMCYGDPNYGTDGYYNDWLSEQERQAQENKMWEEHDKSL